VDRIIDPTTTSTERGDFYEQLGKEFGAAVEPLLWALAANDPIEEARVKAYEAIDLRKARDVASLFAAARREADVRSSRAFLLIDGLVGHPSDEVKEFFRQLFRAEKDRDEEWRAEVLRQIYGTMKGDALIEARLSGYLADRND